jgi:hypothetical protein
MAADQLSFLFSALICANLRLGFAWLAIFEDFYREAPAPNLT